MTQAVGAWAVLQEGRDFYNTPMPGYAPYTYPHPLASARGGPRATPRAAVTDFNRDGHPDYLLQNANTRQTAIWYLNNNVYIGGAYGPTLVAGWSTKRGRGFQSRQPFRLCALQRRHEQTALWYLSGPTYIGGATGRLFPVDGN